MYIMYDLYNAGGTNYINLGWIFVKGTPTEEQMKYSGIHNGDHVIVTGVYGEDWVWGWRLEWSKIEKV